MKALVWRGAEDVRIEDVPEPKVLNPRDAIVRVTSTAICGSDLHLYGGWMPTMQSGDILGHEFMGEVTDVGKGVKNLKKGDRVVVPFCIACGKCWYCSKSLTSLCDNSNPNFRVADKLFGYPTGGLFGYSHMTGGYAGGQAEAVRVPFADFSAFKVDGMSDEQVLFLTDIFPTGYMAAENCDIKPGDVVAVFGCGPVGQFAIKSALMLGAERVIAIDRFPERLRLAQEKAGATEVVNYEQADVMEELHARTGGRGPDSVIDAVGLEAHGTDLGGVYDKVKASLRLATDRPNVLRLAILACRKGGTVSVPGVYGGFLDKVPFGAAMNKGLTIKTGQTHVHRYVKPLMERIRKGEIDPSFVITHRAPLDKAPEMYKTFRAKQDECVKVVLKP